MEKYCFSDFVPQCDNYNEKLKQLQRQYPASAMLNMFAFKKLTAGGSRSHREKLYFSIPDKDFFQNLVLDIEPVVEVRELPNMPISQHKPIEKTEFAPIFVKHPQTDHDDKHALIDQLIEKFSKDAPKIIYSPETHDADADYGEESSIEDISIVSVSLADIYAEQGYYERAIQMYEILKLHFPEKNSIFAARIGELKNLMSDS